jgi:predicted transcriptional regulator
MPAPKGDTWWAEFARDFVAHAKTGRTAHEFAREKGFSPRTVGTTVKRARERGLISPYRGQHQAPELTSKALQILGEERDAPLIEFSVLISAHSKAEALAEAWDVVTQLESWNPDDGEFHFKPARLKNFGTDGG